MSRDGLFPAYFSGVHPRFRTPYRANVLFMIFAGVAGGFLPISSLGHLTSMGTLLAFVIVCVGVMVLRRTDPTRVRAFRTPWVPFVPIAGILICGTLMASLPAETKELAAAWMVIGLAVYFLYSRRHSKLTAG
jgi:APA family basic amino acid/polyamine antiporter